MARIEGTHTHMSLRDEDNVSDQIHEIQECSDFYNGYFQILKSFKKRAT